ncbi:MAG: hypothetical protein AAF329_15245, partial [Cyanobacteria bacterium P01_A01_bin.17]
VSPGVHGSATVQWMLSDPLPRVSVVVALDGICTKVPIHDFNRRLRDHSNIAIGDWQRPLPHN